MDRRCTNDGGANTARGVGDGLILEIYPVVMSDRKLGASAAGPFARRLTLTVMMSVLALTFFLTLHYERDQTSHRRDQQLELDVNSEAARLDEYFERSRSIVRLVARNPAFEGFYDAAGSREDKIRSSIPSLGDANEALRYLNDLYLDSIGEACFIDETGPENARAVRGELASIDDLSPDERDAPFFHPTFALDYNDVYQAKPYISEDTGEWVISNSTLVPFDDGRKRAIVHFEVTVDSFGRLADETDSHIRIVDDDGYVVVDSAHRQLADAPLGHPEQTQFAGGFPPADSMSGLATIGRERIAYQQVGAASDNANVWFAVATAPLANGPLSGFGARSIAILAIAVALVGFARVSAIQHRRLQRLATTDDLTGLPNRTGFHDRAGQALALARHHERNMAIMLIDINGFKDVNDTLGHHRGDELLIDIGRLLETTLRDSDSVARIGGDEFAVVLAETSGASGALESAERASSSALSLQRVIADVPIHVSASIGIAMYPDHGSSIDELLQHADVAMYHAKRNRLPHCLYDRQLDPNSPDRLTIVSELRAGVA